MSAFMVSEAHVDALVTLAVHGPRDGGTWHRPRFKRAALDVVRATPDTADVLAALLATANMASLRARYPDNWRSMTWDGTGQSALDYAWFSAPRCPPTPRLSIVEGFKALDCFEYQSCEVEGWDDTDAAQFCHSLRKSLIHALPGYDDAPWGID